MGVLGMLVAASIVVQPAAAQAVNVETKLGAVPKGWAIRLKESFDGAPYRKSLTVYYQRGKRLAPGEARPKRTDTHCRLGVLAATDDDQFRAGEEHAIEKGTSYTSPDIRLGHGALYVIDGKVSYLQCWVEGDPPHEPTLADVSEITGGLIEVAPAKSKPSAGEKDKKVETGRGSKNVRARGTEQGQQKRSTPVRHAPK